MFTFDNKMLDTYIVSLEKFLMYTGSKFGPSEQLSLESGQVIVHNAVKPVVIENQNDYDAEHQEG